MSFSIKHAWVWAKKNIEQLNTCMGVGPDGGLLPTLI